MVVYYNVNKRYPKYLFKKYLGEQHKKKKVFSSAARTV